MTEDTTQPDAVDPGSGQRGRRSRALGHSNYRLFFGGQAASLIGMWLQLTAQSWLIFRLTGSAAAVGVLAFAMQGPALLLGPVAGALADRHDKRRILVLAQWGSFGPIAVLAALTLSGHVTARQIILLAFLSGLARAFEVPTRQSFIPRLVPPRDLPNAIALNSALFNGARLIGPALAGILIPTVGEGWCFLLNAISYLFIITALRAIKLEPGPPRVRTETSLLREIGEGLSYVRKRPEMSALIAALAVSALCGMPYSVLLPSFAARLLGGGPETYSWLQIAVGTGAVAGAFLLASRSLIVGLERWVVAGNVVFGLSLVILSQTRGLSTALPVLVVIGLSFMIQGATTNTLLQTLSPETLRGRIMSLHTTTFVGLSPFSSLLAGWLADRWGESTVLVFGGLAVAIGGALAGRVTLRHAGKALERAISG